MIGRRTFLPVLPAAAAGAAKRPEQLRPVFRIPFWMSSGSGDTMAPTPAAKVNGGPAKVLAVLDRTTDMVILLVLDLAGDLAQVDPARDALAEHIQQLPANAWVGLMRAQDGLTALEDPTAERGAIVEKIRDLTVSGRAGLLDTVETALGLADRMAAKSRVRMAVFYVTDSDIRNYREDYSNPVINQSDSRDMSRRFPEGIVKEKISRLLTRISTYESPLFVVHLDYRSDTLNNAYQTGLLELATATGGTAAFCRSNAEIPQAIVAMLETIATHQVAIIQSAVIPKAQADIALEAAGSELKYRTRLQFRR
jgi:hypothetical protein